MDQTPLKCYYNVIIRMLTMFKRTLNIKLPEKQSAFLWGPRKSGKSTWLRYNFPDAHYYDFLKSDLFNRFQKQPSLLRQELGLKFKTSSGSSNDIVVLDEVQKIPHILDEVHWMIENTDCRFILCGSSARKLKRGQANLLGGRAWRFQMFPLTSKEIGDVNLLQALNRGLLPAHYTDKQYERTLKGYIHDYLKEEIMAEGLTRNVKAFSLFLDSIAYSNSEMVNYTNIARDCAVDSKTVKEYYQILIDTNLGYYVFPYTKNRSRDIISKTPKFYLFDVGLANSICRQNILEERGPAFGKSLEHLILLELTAHSSYSELDYEIQYWRTLNGKEVDFILGRNDVAIEVKGSSMIKGRELKTLKNYTHENNPGTSILVCNDPHSRMTDGIQVMYWKDFLSGLWNGDII
jgi:predicted AAA+ superfamily ATPase